MRPGPWRRDPRLPGPRALPWLLGAIALAAPCSIEGVLPALSSIGHDLEAHEAAAQQALTVFFAAFAAMMVVHGALSDAIGRRTVLLAASVVFAAASIAAMLAPTLQALLAARFVQGLSAGAGIVVGRAIIRDLFERDEARRVQSIVVMVFALAPAIAPIVTGVLVEAAGWRAVFALLAALGTGAALAVWRWMPETLAPAHRRALNLQALLEGWRSVFARRAFWRVAAALSLLQGGAFVYLASAPRIIETHLGLGPTGFAWLSIPLALGTMAGASAGARLALRLRAHRQVGVGAAVCAAACAANLLLLAAFGTPALPWLFAAPMLFGAGVAIANPTMQMLLLERFADRTGTASSCLALVQTATLGVVGGLVAPLAYGSLAGVAAAQAMLAAAGLAFWFGHRHLERAAARPR